MEQYFYDDLSLGEIADAGGTSRQAVYDLLKRVEESLEKYEKKLRVLQKEESMQFELRGALHLLGALKEEGLGDERLQKLKTSSIRSWVMHEIRCQGKILDTLLFIRYTT